MKLRSSAVVRAALAGTACAALCSQTAWAEPMQGSVIETVTVTAEKRETQAQKTPIAISALSGERLENQGIRGPEQLQFNVPSMVYGQQSGYSFITLRGITTDATDTSSEPSVATYSDGVYTGALTTQNIPEFDLERIEVLRGPQGTLYGRNAVAGVINYISKAPSFDPEANLAFTVGDYNRGAAEGGITGPITDKLAYRMSFDVERRDGYRYDSNLATRQDGLQQWGARGALLFEPNNNLKITLRGDYSSQKTSNPYLFLSSKTFQVSDPLDLLISPSLPLGIFSEPASYFTAHPGLLSPGDIARLNGGSIAQLFGFNSQPGPLPPDPNESTDISTAFATFYDTKSAGSSVTADWNFDGMNLKSITGYRYGLMNAGQESGGYATAITVLVPLFQTNTQWTQEFDLSGTAMSDKLDWLVGAFYLHDRTKFGTMVYLPTFSENLIANISLSSAGPFAYDLSKPILRSLWQIPDILATATLDGPNFGGAGTVRANDISTIPETAFVGFLAKQKTDSVAGFAQATYHLTDSLRVTGGLRFTRDEKNIVRTFHSNFLVAFGASGALCDDEQRDKAWSAVTGAFGADYDLGDQTLLYANYSRGYRSGGFNGSGGCGAGSPAFSPEHLTAYEVGVKSILADGQLLLNAAGFHYDYTDIQFTIFVANATQRVNAGAAKSYGLELEFAAVPDVIPGFSIDGTGSWIHSEYTEGNPFTPTGCFPDSSGHFCLDIIGNELIRSPDFKFSLGTQYAINMGSGGSLTLRGEVAWTDTIFNDIYNGKSPFQSATTQPAYWLSNARISWESESGRYRVQLFGENLYNEHYSNNRISFNAPAQLVTVAGQFAAPRTFGLRFSTKLDGF